MGTHRRSRVKVIVVFILTAAVVHFAAGLFLTERGLALWYPLAVRAEAEEFVPSSNAYAVYYDARLTVSESGVILVGIDHDVSESYDVLGHFLRFAGQYSNIGTVVLDVSPQIVDRVEKLLGETEADRRETRINIIRQRYHVSEDFLDFLTELAYINNTKPPFRKFTAASSVTAERSDGAAQAEAIVSVWEQLVKNGPSENERSVFAVVDIDLLSDDAFLSSLSASLGDRLMVVQTRYAGSGAEKDAPSSMAFPTSGTETKTYFVNGEKLRWFYRYADRVLNLFGQDWEGEEPSVRITGNNRGFFFVIANGIPQGIK